VTAMVAQGRSPAPACPRSDKKSSLADLFDLAGSPGSDGHRGPLWGRHCPPTQEPRLAAGLLLMTSAVRHPRRTLALVGFAASVADINIGPNGGFSRGQPGGFPGDFLCTTREDGSANYPDRGADRTMPPPQPAWHAISDR